MDSLHSLYAQLMSSCQLCGHPLDGGGQLVKHIDGICVGIDRNFNVNSLGDDPFKKLLSKNVDSGEFIFQLRVTYYLRNIGLAVSRGYCQFYFEQGTIELRNLLEEKQKPSCDILLFCRVKLTFVSEGFRTNLKEEV